jgi:hypothetical protein
MHHHSLTSITTTILTFLLLLLLLASFPHHSHSDITLKRGNTTLFHATSFKLLFMNNSFHPFEAPIVPLSYPLPSSLTDGDGVDPTLNGSVALIATSLDSFSPGSNPQPSYDMIRSLRRKGCVGIVFFQEKLESFIKCCQTYILDEWHIPSALLNTSDAITLFPPQHLHQCHF